MSEEMSKYSCDSCRVRKLACSRNLPTCLRCEIDCISCVYSRSGVIRRNRMRKCEESDIRAPYASLGRGHTNAVRVRDKIHTSTSIADHDIEHQEPSLKRKFFGAHQNANATSIQPHLAADIAKVRERLGKGGISNNSSLGALSSLSITTAAVWRDASTFEKNSDRVDNFFLFEDRTSDWVDLFVATSEAMHSLCLMPPTQVIHHLRICRPDKVSPRAWLVMYYGFILASGSQINLPTKQKLRYNLHLALQDACLFLEPTEPNIQALTLLACRVEDFATPSLSWMLARTACGMLQAIGVINGQDSNSKDNERRVILFWHLNLLDKALALVFGRPPTFHRAMVREIGMPTLEDLTPWNGQSSNGIGPGLFGTHFFYQKLLLTQIMADVWHTLYEYEEQSDSRILKEIEKLNVWYGHAQEILSAAAISEKLFLDDRAAMSIDIGMVNFTFTYHYILVLLTKSSDSEQVRYQCINSSKRMLYLLDDLVADPQEPNVGIICQLLCAPFTPFLELFGEIIMPNGTNKDRLEEKKEALNAIEKLPRFLGKMRATNEFARKLERIACVFVEHANCVTQAEGSTITDTAPRPSIFMREFTEGWQSPGNALHWDVVSGSNELWVPDPRQVNPEEDGVRVCDVDMWTSDFFGEAMFNWMGWNRPKWDRNV